MHKCKIILKLSKLPVRALTALSHFVFFLSLIELHALLKSQYSFQFSSSYMPVVIHY